MTMVPCGVHTHRFHTPLDRAALRRRAPEAIAALHELGDRLVGVSPTAQSLAILQQVAWDTVREYYGD